MRVVGGDEKGSLESETVKYGRCAGEDQEQVNDRLILSSERMLYKGYDSRSSVEKTILAVILTWLVTKTN
jgi:hypothetical protein